MAEAFHIRDDFMGNGVLADRLPPVQEGAAQGLRWDAWDQIEDNGTHTGWLIIENRMVCREGYY